MKKIVIMVLGVTLIMFMNGCTVAKVSGKGSVPIVLNQPDKKVKVIKTFKESKMRMFDYTGSFEITDMTSKVVSDTNADALSNVQFNLEYGIPEYFINLFTLGFANAMSIEITGEAVKYEEATK